MKYEIYRNRHKNADFKDVNVEKCFLGALLHNATAFEKIVNSFNSEVFTNSIIKKIYDKMVEFYRSQDEVVTGIDLINTLSIPEEKRGLYKSIYKKAFKHGIKHHTTEYILTKKYKLEQLYSARIIELGTKDVISVLTKAIRGDYSEISKATEIIQELPNIVGSKSFNSVKLNPVHNFEKWLHDFEKWQKNPQNLLGIPTGIPQIDKVITGIRPSEFGLCIADTGVGKSIFLLDVAVNCWMMQGDVIYVTIEMPANQIEDRFWCNLSGINYSKFRKLSLDKNEKSRIRSIVSKYKRHDFNFNIVDMREGCTISDIASACEPYVKSGKIKLIAVDYLNIVSSEGTKRVELNWESQVANAMNMKQQIARRFKLPVWSACQVSGDNLAFAKHIKDNIDIGVKFDEDEDTEHTGIVHVSYPKARDFRGVRHTLETDRGLMRMYRENGAHRNIEMVGDQS